VKIRAIASVALSVLALTWMLALPAIAAVKLSIPTASERALAFAKRTCSHDKSCVKYGVTNCRRQGLHVVLCRIGDERDTEAQGRYVCTRLVRVALNPANQKVRITGLGEWSCG
jgi:hypothetical protein